MLSAKKKRKEDNTKYGPIEMTFISGITLLFKVKRQLIGLI